MDLWAAFSLCCVLVVLLSLSIYLFPLIYIQYLAPAQNLRKRYQTSWALVTGASSGIGRSVAIKLALQGLNVVLVALDDARLQATITKLNEAFPGQCFRAVGVDLTDASGAYMREIADATADVDVGIVVNNAGFLLLGFFNAVPIERHIGLIECNAGAAVRIAHHFYSRMIRKSPQQRARRGLLAFTSSAAWFLPSPFATMYGGSKALLSSFAVSLSVESEKHGVDVCVVHPSYTRTNLYESSPKLFLLDLLEKFAWTPDQVADVLLRAAGRVIAIDVGAYSVITRMVNNLFEAGLLAKAFVPYRELMAPKPQQEAPRKSSKN